MTFVGSPYYILA